ncbi:1,2-phenylacetyl-CoA epoxidase subunit PaaC [Actinacidiphila sp. ITFR-21]|uniref:1,2-phenylacetyl-CoA epoxidase subunit PaaC n=1 Tax=Actinacidiphila sp. ITFR-21 TaxID=3075199 RepID=UPI00288928CE|nr:1,2-phenylacetyl-CoA epoxidase subunit PaaC [Streptomyces sp. ITFR-21]WNI18896.1 1,2-phenylacetyl-CoA epoxidase subunit PaaC [Streptomyces sp. ITFR-21]
MTPSAPPTGAGPGPTRARTPYAYVLRLADDALIAAQRMAEWCAGAPQLEEDVALANIALDLLGQARALLTHAGELEGRGRDEDALAFQREESDFGNVQLVELPNGDFAYSMAKLLFLAAYQELLYEGLSGSQDPTLAAVAAKAVKESAYHLDHAATWTERLGDGTEESHRRMRTAVAELWPYTHALFAADPLSARVAADGVGVDPAALRPAWLRTVGRVLERATLAVPDDGWAPAGGREGVHTESFSLLLMEMQSLHRAHPGVAW